MFVFGTTTTFLRSDIGGLQLVEHVRFSVAACLLLPVGVLLLQGQEVAVFVSFRIRSVLQADGGAAGFGEGGVVVVVEVVVAHGRVSPAGFTPGRLPLMPLPPQRCLGLSIAETEYNCHQESLEVAENIDKEVIDGPADASLGSPW